MRNYRKNKLNSSVASADMRAKVEKLVNDAIMGDLEYLMNVECISGVSTDLDRDPDYNWEWAGLISNHSKNDDIEADIDNRINEGLKMIRDAWVDFYLYHANEDVNSSRRITNNHESRRLNSARTVYHPEWNTLEAGWEVTDIVSEILNIDQQTYVRYVIEETCLLYKPIANSEMSEFGYRFITSIDGKKHTVWIEANTDTGRSDICKQIAVEVARVITDTYKRAGELLP